MKEANPGVDNEEFLKYSEKIDIYSQIQFKICVNFDLRKQVYSIIFQFSEREHDKGSELNRYRRVGKICCRL